MSKIVNPPVTKFIKKSNKITKTAIKTLENNPHIEGSKLSVNQLEDILNQAIIAYYNTDTPLLTDSTYDILETILKQCNPDSSIFKKVGTPVPNTVDKVKLPYYLGSLDKVKPGEKSLTKWLKDHNRDILISEKIDGLSSLLVITGDDTYSTGIKMKLYKHGDGYEGQDISQLLENISLSPVKKYSQSPDKNQNIKLLNIGEINKILDEEDEKNKKQKCHIALRGEIIIKTAVYESKYSKMYPKARSLIAGIVNSKTPEESIVKDMEIVFYELINPAGLTFQQQFELIQKMGFHTAKYNIFKTLEESQLPEILIQYKKESHYEIDGIVLDDSSQVWSRATKNNPDYAVAFKMPLEEQVANTKVINVEYNISKHGTLAPRIEYFPVVIKGDTHKYTTGFNLKYIVDNKINIGTEIQIIKSGDVIPYIYKILKQSQEPMMPDKNIKWHWTDTHVDAVLDNPESSNDVLLQKLIAFFSVMKIAGVGEGVVKKFVNAGYNQLKTILELTPDIITEIEGFQRRSAQNVYDAIKKVLDNPQPLERVMMASGVFEIGLGEKKFKMILDAIPDFMNKYKNGKITNDTIQSIPGFSIITTNIFLTGMPKFLEWLELHNNLIKIITEDMPKSNPMTINNKFAGMIAVFTGVRNSDIENAIIAGSGQIGSSISGKTTIVIAKDPLENSGKINKARELGIQIISIDEFKTNYGF